MQKNEELIGILNDLMRINNDRFDEYKRALKKTREADHDLREFFCNMADDSRKNTSALISQILKLRSLTSTGAAFTGNVYRGWLHAKADFNVAGCASILDYCTLMEKEVHRAYESASGIAIDMPDHIRNILADQKRRMKGSYGMVNIHHGFYETASA